MIYELAVPQNAACLFCGWEETIIWSCLQGVMGKIYGNDSVCPDTAMAVLGDFAFFAGRPEKELVMYKPGWCRQDFIIMVPRNEEWGGVIESCYKERAKKVSRYAMKKETGNFDKEKLRKAAGQLPEGYTIRPMDEALYFRCKDAGWSRDLVSLYESYDQYHQLGIGMVVLKEGEMVSGASSYSRYRDGIEIEIDTKEGYRRKGLAYSCSAGLILECLKRGLYPSWDAQNTWSAALAKKLGYHHSHTYTAYEIWDF